MDVSIWIEKLLASFENCEVATIIKLIKEPKITNVREDIIGMKVAQIIDDEDDQKNFTEFAFNLANYLILEKSQMEILKAFSFLDTAIRRYMTFYRSSVVSGSWSIKLIETFCKMISNIAYPAENKYQKVKEETKDVAESPLKMAKTCLENIFSKCQIIKEQFPDSRKMGAFYAVIHVCEMYFKEGKFRMCLRFIDWVNKMQDGFEHLPDYVKSSYYYYEGLLYLFRYKYLESEKSMNLSVKNCTKEKDKFFRNIQLYFIPLNMMLGIFQEEEMLEKFNFPYYIQISKACQEGSLGMFEAEMAKYENKFLKIGIFLFMEKLKNIVLRNLFKKAYEANQSNHINQIETLVDQYNKSLEDVKSEDYTVDEYDKVDKIGMECILSGLIYKGYIKGYISNEKSILVLSKKEPFPELRAVVETNGHNI